jgi:hypothetical protein
MPDRRPRDSRDLILADMEREIEAAIRRAFRRLDELSPSGEPTASPFPVERSRLRLG